MNQWLKLPGLFHRYELEQVIDAAGHHEYRFERVESGAQGPQLIAVYCRRHEVPRDALDAHPRPAQLARSERIGGAP